MSSKLWLGRSEQACGGRRAVVLVLSGAAAILMLAACATQPSSTAQTPGTVLAPGTAQPAVADAQQPAGAQPTATAQPAAGQPSATAQPPAAAAAASGYTGPHFATPQAAMLYLTSAYNSYDNATLHALTAPQAYKALQAMRSGAVNLQLLSCVADGKVGDYICTFRHDYPVRLHQKGQGSSEFLVAPAINPGWYMYRLLDCG